MNDRRDDHDRIVPRRGATARLVGLCIALAMMATLPGCNGADALDADEVSESREEAPQRGDMADIYDSEGNRPQRPTLDPKRIVEQGDMDQLLGFLYWHRNPDWQDDQDLSLLAQAAYSGNQEIVETLLYYGANVNATVRVNNTALHWAVRGDQVETAEILLKNGADPNVAGGPDRTMTPMQLATSRGNQEIVELLTRYGAMP